MEKQLSTGVKLKRRIILFSLILVIGSSFCDLFSQNIRPKPTRQSSFEAFSKGNFEQAYNEFSELLLTYSKDPLYKYYSGVCLVKLSRNPGEAVTLLQQALQSAGVVKTLPSDALFYLGRAQQMSGKYSEAVESFNLYTEQVGKKTAREQGVPEFVQQCNEKKGEVTETVIKPVEAVKNEKNEVNQTKNESDMNEAVSQTVKSDTSAKVNIPAGFDKILGEALGFQFKADSLNALSGEQNKELEKLQNPEKLMLKEKITENELLAASFQKSADQKYSEAQAAMNPQKEKTQINEITQHPYNKAIKDTVKQPFNKVVRDSLKQTGIKTIKDTIRLNEKKSIKENDKQSDTIKKVVPVVKKTVESFAFFEVLAKPGSDSDEKIEIDPDVPPGLIYRIQIAVFRNPVAPAYFRGITPVSGFKVEGADKTNYYAGMFRRSSDAKKALPSVKALGFKDAFVVAFSGNKPVSADRAATLEKEWGKKPFISIVKAVSETPADTVPPTLTFRVEVIRSLKPLKEDIVDGIIKIAGSRGLDIKPLDDGNNAYLIGNFITFESAEEYADLLVRNGYR